MIVKLAPEVSRTLPGDAQARNAAEPSGRNEQALTLAAMGLYEEAIDALHEVTARAPGHAPAWQVLAELLRLAGKDKEAEAASSRAAGAATEWSPALDPRTLGEIDAAERALRERMREIAARSAQMETLLEHLRSHETDVT